VDHATRKSIIALGEQAGEGSGTRAEIVDLDRAAQIVFFPIGINIER
jgi:hypothetical protein